MSEPATNAHSIQGLVGDEVVIDMGTPFVAIGTLIDVRDDYLVLEAADLHDLRDTATTREKYVLDSHNHGVRPNRRQVWISRDQTVAVSRLADVVRD
ncbi:MAG: hypothetical protein R3C10_05820 [Pirellulales bacterium]|nr:hypothetical protein [Planctomycetales bacterium]